jgi:4-hydroxy-tetrahydrodipicolinate synthase
VDRAKGRIPVFVGTGAMRTPDSLALASGARDMGAGGILLGTPPYSVPTERENALNALAIDRAADLPIILYNYPGRMGVEMGCAFLDRVGRSRNVIGIKESSGDINRVHLLARDYPHIQTSCGMDDQALEFFAWGARSWICAGSNFLPEEHIALYETCAVNGDFSKGHRIMSAMMPLMRVLEQGGKFIQCVKHGVAATGLRSGPMRPPLKGLNKDEKRELEEVIRRLKTTIQAIREGN